MQKKKVRLDQLIVERGLLPTRTKAQFCIMAGEVMVNSRIAQKPSELVSPDSEISIREKPRYVSRGGLKLESALDAFGLNPQGKIILDIGASTGGFTDCLIKAGAKKVYALDVGKGLIHPSLRANPKVVVIEKKNARYLKKGDIAEKVDIITIDVSFISLKLILGPALNFLKEGGEILALVKPQFELSPKEVKKGVVQSKELQLKAVEEISRFSEKELGLATIGFFPSALKGPKGNQEYFLYLKS